MGFFNRKKFNPNKLYSRAETLRMLSMEEFLDYTTVEVNTGKEIKYKIITIDESKKLEKQERANMQKSEFAERINGGGAYRDISVTPKYNNYQNARKYMGDNAYYR